MTPRHLVGRDAHGDVVLDQWVAGGRVRRGEIRDEARTPAAAMGQPAPYPASITRPASAPGLDAPP